MSTRNLRRIERLENGDRNRKQPAADYSWVQDATRDAYVWVTNHTKTWNEHWQEEGRPDPYEPFPRWPYLACLFALFSLERIIWILKSRDMMVTWVCVAYLTLEAMKVPRRGVLFQTEKEEKVKQLIKYSKVLYEMQDARIKKAYPLLKPLNMQSDMSLEFAHGGKITGIPGGANQIRSYHPWGYLNDESSFQPDAGECYNEALSAVSGKIIFNSSAYPGWYADVCRGIVRNEEE